MNFVLSPSSVSFVSVSFFKGLDIDEHQGMGYHPLRLILQHMDTQGHLNLWLSPRFQRPQDLSGSELWFFGREGPPKGLAHREGHG